MAHCLCPFFTALPLSIHICIAIPSLLLSPGILRGEVGGDPDRVGEDQDEDELDGGDRDGLAAEDGEPSSDEEL